MSQRLSIDPEASIPDTLRSYPSTPGESWPGAPGPSARSGEYAREAGEYAREAGEYAREEGAFSAETGTGVSRRQRRRSRSGEVQSPTGEAKQARTRSRGRRSGQDTNDFRNRETLFEGELELDSWSSDHAVALAGTTLVSPGEVSPGEVSPAEVSPRAGRSGHRSDQSSMNDGLKTDRKRTGRRRVDQASTQNSIPDAVMDEARARVEDALVDEARHAETLSPSPPHAEGGPSALPLQTLRSHSGDGALEQEGMQESLAVTATQPHREDRKRVAVSREATETLPAPPSELDTDLSRS